MFLCLPTYGRSLCHNLSHVAFHMSRSIRPCIGSSYCKIHFREPGFDHWVWTFQNHFFQLLAFLWFNITLKHAPAWKVCEKFFSLVFFNQPNSSTDSSERWRSNLIWRFDTYKNMHFSVSHKNYLPMRNMTHLIKVRLVQYIFSVIWCLQAIQSPFSSFSAIFCATYRSMIWSVHVKNGWSIWSWVLRLVFSIFDQLKDKTLPVGWTRAKFELWLPWNQW